MRDIINFLVIVGSVFWLYQLVSVGTMRDEEFNGRNDKVIFFITVFFGWVIGALVFYRWKKSQDAVREADKRIEARLQDELARCSGERNTKDGT